MGITCQALGQPQQANHYRSMMKVLLSILCLAAVVAAEDEEAKFLTVDNSGATLLINSTSLIYAAVIGIPLIAITALIALLFGFDFGGFFAKERSDTNYNSQLPYATQDFQHYYNSVNRNLELLHPVFDKLKEAYE